MPLPFINRIFYSHSPLVSNPIIGRITSVSVENKTVNMEIIFDYNNNDNIEISFMELNKWYSDRAIFIKSSKENRQQIYKKEGIEFVGEQERFTHNKFINLIEHYEKIIECLEEQIV